MSCTVPEWGGGGVLCWVSCKWSGLLVVYCIRCAGGVWCPVLMIQGNVMAVLGLVYCGGVSCSVLFGVCAEVWFCVVLCSM